MTMTTQGRFIVTSSFWHLQTNWDPSMHKWHSWNYLLLTTCSWNDGTVITPMTGTNKRRHPHQRASSKVISTIHSHILTVALMQAQQVVQPSCQVVVIVIVVVVTTAATRTTRR